MKPQYGDIRGGTNIIFTGNYSGLLTQSDNAMFCLFGDSASSPVRFTSESEMECTSPPSTGTAVVEMGLFIREDDVFSLSYAFHYIAELEFISLAPSIVSENMGGFVTISGGGFIDSNDAFCIYDSAPEMRQSVTFISAVEIHCPLPRLKPGVTEVSVSLDGDKELSTGLSFTVKAQPTLLSMTPQLDFVHGGAVAEFAGLNLFFSDSLRCLFGKMWTEAALRYGKVICTVPRLHRSLSVLE